MGEDEKALGQRLSEARRKVGLTQQELCHKAGLSYSTLAKIERGAIKSPSIFTVAAISKATGESLDNLLNTGLGGVAGELKKTSKSGVKFVFFDVNGTLARFYERAFAQVAADAGVPAEIIESIFLHYDGAACRGSMTNAEVEKIIGAEVGLKNFSWEKYYLSNIESTPGMNELLGWISQHYGIGIISNNWLGYTEKLLAKKLIPDVNYAAVIESAKVKCSKPEAQIYELATKTAGLEPHEILLVDDMQAYAYGAEKQGWQAMVFNQLDPVQSIGQIREKLAF